MKPFACNEHGEPFVLLSHIGISTTAVLAEELSCIQLNGQIYVSLEEGIEFLEESLADREHIAFFERALNSFTLGEWHPDD